MAKVYKILLHDHDLENIIFPALDSASAPLNQNARGLIEMQMVLLENFPHDETANAPAEAPAEPA